MDPFAKLPIGIAVLSWRSPETIKNTLATYFQHDFLTLFEDAVLCFQEISNQDRALAEELRVRYVGKDRNDGIMAGFRFAYESLNTEYVIVLENDCLLRENRETAHRRLSESLELLQTGKADLARVRSLYHPGPPIRAASEYSRFYTIQQQANGWANSEQLSTSSSFVRLLRRLTHPLKARKWIGRSVYIEEHPELKHPKYIHKIGDSFIVDSSVLPWTNQPTLLSRSFLGELLDFADAHPSSRTVNGFQDFEKNLNCAHWQNKHYQIAVSPGIFSHQRLDR